MTVDSGAPIFYPDFHGVKDLKTPRLVIVPTPIKDGLPLHQHTKEVLGFCCLHEDTILLVEEHKRGRRRWLDWGLPREAIERFELFNEHNQIKDIPDVLGRIGQGKTAFLISDCGLPGFCDPGQMLVAACHEVGIQVTSLIFDNSVSLAIALSGLPHIPFEFLGFLPRDKDERKKTLKICFNSKNTSVFMDTPYRLISVLEDIMALGLNKEFFLACDLLSPDQICQKGNVEDHLQLFKNDLLKGKREFIICTGKYI